MTGYKKGSAMAAFGRLSIVTSGLLMVFAFLGLVMTGLAGEAISLMETHTWLPFTASLGCLAAIFMSSGTRNPSYYHPAEQALIGLTVVIMGAHAFMAEAQDFVTTHEPVSQIVILVVMLVCGAVLAR